MKSVVIIGASHAAVEAISTLRKKGWEGKISLIGDEPTLPYQRPPLSKAYYKGEFEAEKLLLKKQQFYTDANVDLYLGRSAYSIDRQAKQVLLSEGEKISYDKLILANSSSGLSRILSCQSHIGARSPSY